MSSADFNRGVPAPITVGLPSPPDCTSLVVQVIMSRHSPASAGGNQNFVPVDWNDDPPRWSCAMCPRTFEQSARLSAHMYKVHPNQWNEIKRQRDASYRLLARTYVQWTLDDLKRMAALKREASSLNIHNTNPYIASCMACTSDQVSCRRRRKDYKDLLKSLESSAPCPGSDGVQPLATSDTHTRDHSPARTPPAAPLAPVVRTSCIWSGPEIKILTSAPPGTTDADLVPLLPGRTLIAIRSKRKRLPKVAAFIDVSESVPLEPGTPG
ncbi:unnamed protein product [Acanthosepion pharaonis]|uniref:C2H2-type domain-containing protein n=1 Tax=Acanthosepion pharaonis TaxID=158019 RepID=A0A812CY12_ACAPH|nr:unnamed protein product [Sepia pharaonis]